MARVMKDSGIEWIGEIPEEWAVSKVKYFIDCYDGRRVPVDAGERVSGPYPYWGAGSITDYVDSYLFDEEVILLGEDGAPFFDPTRPVAFLVNEKIWVNNHIHVLKPHSDVYPAYLLHFLNTVDYKTYINGSILNKLTQSNMNSIAFVVPTYDEQQRIADFLDCKCAEIDAVIEKTKATIEEYKKLKQSVITEAVTKGSRGTRPMKDSGIEWIGEIPEDWEITRVKHVAKRVTDGAHVSPELENGVFDFVSTVNLSNGKIDFDNCLKTSEQSYRQFVSTGCQPHKNDVLISKDGTVGKTAIVDFEHDFVVASSLVIISPLCDVIIPAYLNYNLQAKFTQDALLLLMHGAGLKRVSIEKNANLTVVLPSYSEQEEIVTYLDEKCAALDTLIAKKTALLIELETYKKSLIYEYVTGKKECRIG